MKHLRLTLLVIGCIAMMATSCKKDKDDNNTPAPATSTEFAKWIVTGTNATYFTSFEFNKSGQAIVVTPSDVIFKNYTRTGNTITIPDFGTLAITRLDATAFEFTLTTLTKSAQATYEITTTRASQMPSTGNTALLCRTWTLVSVDSVPTAGTAMDCRVLFSEAGTYLVYYLYYNTSGLSTWAWKPGSQDHFCYSWEGTPDCSGNHECRIDILNANLFRMTDLINDSYYILVPYTAKETWQWDNFRKPAYQSVFGF